MILYLSTLIATIVIESYIAIAMNRRERGRLQLDAPLINLLTHPLARMLIGAGVLSWAVAELLIVILEAFLYATVTRLPARRAILTSVVANGVTIILALILRPLL